MSNLHTSLQAFARGFHYAAQGIAHTIRTQRNMRVHLGVALAVAAAGIGFGISAIEWAVVLLAIGMVFAAETMNTVAETIVDLISPERHPLAKIAKDAAAGAVLLSVLGAVGVGVAVFLPRLLALGPR